MRDRRRTYSDHIRITLTGKITATYLLFILFSLIAIGYALNSLHDQTSVSRRLVNVEIRAAALARDLQADLRLQERLAGQLTIRMNQEAVELLREKLAAGSVSQRTFAGKLDQKRLAHFSELFAGYQDNSTTFINLLLTQPAEAEAFYESTLGPQQRSLYDDLKLFREAQQEKIDQALEHLSEDSDRAFRVTMTLLLAGLILSTPVVISVLLSMHRSLRRLRHATQQIANGNYDLDIGQVSRDEFGQLTHEFLAMGHKLREYEILNLDANPLTHLPGNLMIQRRVEELLKEGTPFAHAFVDLDHFKAYNDRYGFQKGSDVISMVGEIVNRIVGENASPVDFVGHIGGDDYIFLTSPDMVEELAQRIIDEFDRRIPEFYTEKDRLTGSFICEDRFGVERQFQIMTVSIAIVSSNMSNYTSATALSHECAKMKEHLKRLPGSNYLIDRRKGTS